MKLNKLPIIKTLIKLPRYFRTLDTATFCHFLWQMPLGIMTKFIQRQIDKPTRWETVIRAPGVRFPIYLRPGTTDMSSAEECLFDEEYRYALPTKAEPWVIIDAGANIGCTSIYYANRYPHALVIALEPEDSNYRMLVRNTEHYQNIKPLKMALWSETKRLNLATDGCHMGFHCWDGDDGTTPAISIPDLMKMFNLSQIDILKMDIEGAERQVLENSEGWIDKVNLLAVGLHDYINPHQPPFCKMALDNVSRHACAVSSNNTTDNTTFVYLNNL